MTRFALIFITTTRRSMKAGAEITV